jgi:hypothetical protein
MIGKDGLGNVIIERYYAVNEKGDLLLVQHALLEKLFWSYNAFFGKTKAATS